MNIKMLSDKTEHGVRNHFKNIQVKKDFDQSNVQAGREYVKAYVEYTHYVKAINDAAARTAIGHFPAEAAKPRAAQPHKE